MDQPCLTTSDWSECVRFDGREEQRGLGDILARGELVDLTLGLVAEDS
jgi:hypothetical protein